MLEKEFLFSLWIAQPWHLSALLARGKALCLRAPRRIRGREGQKRREADVLGMGRREGKETDGTETGRKGSRGRQGRGRCEGGKEGAGRDGSHNQGRSKFLWPAVVQVSTNTHWAEMYLELHGAAGLPGLMKGRPSVAEVISNKFLPLTQNFHGIVCMAAS